MDTKLKKNKFPRILAPLWFISIFGVIFVYGILGGGIGKMIQKIRRK